MLKIIVRLGDGWEHVGTHIFWFPFSRWFAAFVLEKKNFIQIETTDQTRCRFRHEQYLGSIWAANQ